MRRPRMWPLGITVVLFSLTLGGHAWAQGVRVRWDITTFTSFNPPTIQAGGQASALAEDGSKITLTGTGTFSPEELDAVTGGGEWVTRDPSGAVTGMGTYQVTGLVRWNEAPGTIAAVNVDTIGKHEDYRPGLAILRVAYSDGSRGILVVSCRSRTAPPSIMEGITASKGFNIFWNREPAKPNENGNYTIFHVVR